MKMIFRLESNESIHAAFKNKVSRFTSKEMEIFANFLFEHRNEPVDRNKIADECSMQAFAIAPLVARMRQAGFMVNNVGTRMDPIYQVVGIHDKPKCQISGMVIPKLNPLIEAVFC